MSTIHKIGDNYIKGAKAAIYLMTIKLKAAIYLMTIKLKAAIYPTQSTSKAVQAIKKCGSVHCHYFST